MGIIKAISAAARGTMADQWLEMFCCDALDVETLVRRGQKMQSDRSANSGSDNVISSGSIIVVADGMCALVTEAGKVIACYDTPGEHKFISEASNGLFGGGGLTAVAKDVGSRIGFGGDAAIVQRVYYVNTKESHGNVFAVESLPVRLYDANTTLDMDASVTLHGVFSYRIVDPVLFYKNVSGNVSGYYTRSTLGTQLRAELVSVLSPALYAVCEQGIRPSDLLKYTEAICERIQAAASEKWRALRGIEAISVALDTLQVVPADLAAAQQAQRTKMLTDPAMAAAELTAAAADAMTAAASNPSGGAVGLAFLSAANAAPKLWHCPCGAWNSSAFCETCGKKRK